MVMAIFWLRKRNAIVLKYTEKLFTSVSPYLVDHEPLQHCTLQQNAFKESSFTIAQYFVYRPKHLASAIPLCMATKETLSQHNPHLRQMCWCETHQDIFHGFPRRKHSVCWQAVMCSWKCNITFYERCPQHIDRKTCNQLLTAL